MAKLSKAFSLIQTIRQIKDKLVQGALDGQRFGADCGVGQLPFIGHMRALILKRVERIIQKMNGNVINGY
jgi:hypothetical protein